jgi:hypothetical protein
MAMNEKTQKLTGPRVRSLGGIQRVKFQSWVERSGIGAVSLAGGYFVADLARPGAINYSQSGESNVTDEPESQPTGTVEAPVRASLIYESAPIAHQVTDDMPFGEAFRTAREEVGPGGVFNWQGKIYNTYFREELDALSPEQLQQFRASVEIKGGELQVSEAGEALAGTVIPEGTGLTEEPEDFGPNTTPEVIRESPAPDSAITSQRSAAPVQMEPEPEEPLTAEIVIDDEFVDDGLGGQVHIALVQRGEELIVKLDSDGDGSFDQLLGFVTEDDQGNLWLLTTDGNNIPMTINYEEGPADMPEAEPSDLGPAYEERPHFLEDDPKTDNPPYFSTGGASQIYNKDDYDSQSQEASDWV